MNLAAMFTLGVGVERDEAEAFRLTLDPARKGEATSICNAAVGYAKGSGVAKDPVEAFA